MSVLIFGDSLRSPDLRHVFPLAIGDPFFYAEHDGRRVAFLPSIEVPRARELDGLEVVSYNEIGSDELQKQGLGRVAMRLEMLHRVCTSLGIDAAVTPLDFPAFAADFLRGRGVEVTVDAPMFADRRRSKTAGELAGMRRAQAATQAAMGAMRDEVRRGGSISSESLRTAARRETADADVFFEYMIVAHGAQGASVHEPGFGPIEPGESIIIDLGVRDAASGAWADMTRTFCVGTPPDELVGYQKACLEALQTVIPMIGPGVSCAELHRVADGIIAEAGYPTLLTKDPALVMLEDGFLHSLGHGVGLEIHEPPSLGPNGEDLVVGDVITIEPGVYRRGFGGCRLEDYVLVTADGYENLTDFPYEL